MQRTLLLQISYLVQNYHVQMFKSVPDLYHDIV